MALVSSSHLRGSKVTYSSYPPSFFCVDCVLMTILTYLQSTLLALPVYYWPYLGGPPEGPEGGFEVAMLAVPAPELASGKVVLSG
jgi:hypothetical protein